MIDSLIALVTCPNFNDRSFQFILDHHYSIKYSINDFVKIPGDKYHGRELKHSDLIDHVQVCVEFHTW